MCENSFCTLGDLTFTKSPMLTPGTSWTHRKCTRLSCMAIESSELVQVKVGFNELGTLYSSLIFLAALEGGALCQIRSKLRVSTRDHIFEYEFSKKNQL